jgi:hypothetical protein
METDFFLVTFPSPGGGISRAAFIRGVRPSPS